jgi:glycosyltransferase involved in cell wall biosynthesis
MSTTDQLPKISIVTPSFNQAAFIEEALRSVKREEYPGIEHIVVDGNSTDSTVEVLTRHGSQRGWEHLRWFSEPDRGQAHAINKGMHCARGEILAYLCSDDAYAPGALAFAGSFFKEHPAVDCIYGDCWFVDENGQVLRKKKAVPFNAARLQRANCIWQPTVFFRRRAWETVGDFNERLHLAMDYEYWLRMARVARIQAVNRHLAIYRWQQSSKTVTQTGEHLREAYSVARSFGGGGIVSWYLHRVYWPYTAGLKRWMFGKWLALSGRPVTL